MTLGAFDPVLQGATSATISKLLQKVENCRHYTVFPKSFWSSKTASPSLTMTSLNTLLQCLEDKASLYTCRVTRKQYVIYKCGPHFGPVSDTDYADVFVKVDSRYDNYTVEEIKANPSCFIPRCFVSICQVEKGCFQFTFQVPSFVQQEIFPLSTDQTRTLEAEGVIKLTCGEYQFHGDNEDCDEKPQLNIVNSLILTEAQPWGSVYSQVERALHCLR